jgi:hypothetical protein
MVFPTSVLVMFLKMIALQRYVWVEMPSPLRGEGWERVTEE